MNAKMRNLNIALDWEWINEEVPILQVEDSCGIVATDGNNPVGAMVADNWLPNSVQVHLIIKDPMLLRTDFLQTCLSYVFDTRGIKVGYSFIVGSNEKALKLSKHMGATEKCRFEDAFANGTDYVIMELRKENCIYLKKIEEAA